MFSYQAGGFLSGFCFAELFIQIFQVTVEYSEALFRFLLSVRRRPVPRDHLQRAFGPFLSKKSRMPSKAFELIALCSCCINQAISAAAGTVAASIEAWAIVTTERRKRECSVLFVCVPQTQSQISDTVGTGAT